MREATARAAGALPSPPPPARREQRGGPGRPAARRVPRSRPERRGLRLPGAPTPRRGRDPAPVSPVERVPEPAGRATAGGVGRCRRSRRRPPDCGRPPRASRACARWRARIRPRKPGASASTRSSIRAANTSVSRASQRPVRSPPASLLTCCGTCVYAQATSLPGGARSGSTEAYWPRTRNGDAGIALRASWFAWMLSSSMLSPTCTTPARAASGAAQGIGPSSAQSTLTVALSHWKRRMSARTRAGTCSRARSSR